MYMSGGQEKATSRCEGEGCPSSAEGRPTSSARCRTPREGYSDQQATKRATNTDSKTQEKDNACTIEFVGIPYGICVLGG